MDYPLMGEDAIHGHSFWKGATIFPTQLALACSWNPIVNAAGAPVVEPGEFEILVRPSSRDGNCCGRN